MSNEPDAKQGTQLNRVLGPVSAMSIVIGAIIGVGIFFTPSSIVKITASGNLAMIAWIVGGVIAMLGALCFSELGTMYTRSGGQYAILRDSYGPLGGFLFVFCNATAIQCGASAIIAFICANHLSVAVTGSEPDGVWGGVIATALIVGLCLSNVIGVKFGSTIQNVTVFAKVATLIAIISLALFAQPAAPAPIDSTTVTGSPISLIFAALVPVLFSFGGWQHALWIGGEIRNPRKNVPLAMIGGVSVVILVYMGANWAYLRLLGDAGVANSGALAADAVSTVLPETGTRIVAAAVAFSAFGVMNAILMSGPRLLFGMAKDGRFFAPFKQVHKIFHTPYVSIMLISTLALILVWVAGLHRIDALLAGVVLIDATFMALTGYAVIVLRKKKPDTERAVRVPLYPIVPILFVLGMLAVITGVFLNDDSRKAAPIGLAWMVAAAICYFAFFRNKAKSA